MTAVEAALAALAAGRAVVVADDRQGQLVMAADAVDTDSIAFFLRHTAGLIGVALPAQRLDELDRALEQIAAAGRGVCVYVRQPEGRGLRLHSQTPAGAGWLDPDVTAERWEEGIAAQILADLGVRHVRLLSTGDRV